METQPLLDDAEATIDKQVINQLHGLLPKRVHLVIRLPSFFQPIHHSKLILNCKPSMIFDFWGAMPSE
jgi:hypothetical protein